MNRNSVKSAGRSAKTGARSAKKGAKSALSAIKKAAAKSSRRAPASARPSRRITVRAPSVAPNITSIADKILRTPSPPVQPASPSSEIQLRAHKYQVGETVYYTSPTFGRAAASGSYKVVKLLPSEGDDYQYRIKSSGEAFERVAKESQLDRA
jgi:hypothetical protein